MALKSGVKSEVSWAITAALEASFLTSASLKNYPDIVGHILEFAAEARPFIMVAEGGIKHLQHEVDGLSQTADDVLQRQKELEALLFIRNVSFTPETAQMLANSRQCIDMVICGLQLPETQTSFVEIKAYCLDIAEAISFHVTPESGDDPLFVAVLRNFQTNGSDDRGVLIPSLRCLSRMLVRADASLVEAIPKKTVISIVELLLVDDEDIIGIVLDFLYQFTANGSNIPRLLNTSPSVARLCETHLVRLLTWGMPDPKMDYIRLPRKTKKKPPENPPSISDEILAELLDLQEPDRATHWIRTAYEDDPDGEVTQISLWKAYESQFEQHARTHGRRLLPAVDFIKNVTSAFKTSAAMVVNLPDGSKRFIIKGIRPREVAVAPSALRAQANAEANPQPDKPQTAEPTSFGVTATLVLQNLARTPDGRRILRPAITDLVAASLKNAAIAQYVEDLLDILNGEDPRADAGKSASQ